MIGFNFDMQALYQKFITDTSFTNPDIVLPELKSCPERPRQASPKARALRKRQQRITKQSRCTNR